MINLTATIKLKKELSTYISPENLMELNENIEDELRKWSKSFDSFVILINEKEVNSIPAKLSISTIQVEEVKK